MRCVIVLSDLGAGGSQRLALWLAGQLICGGHSVEVMTLEHPETKSFFPVPAGVCVHRLGMLSQSSGPLAALVANRARVVAVRRALVEGAPDLVLSLLTSTNVIALIAARPLRIPVIVCEESDPAHEQIPRSWVLLRGLSYRFARHIVVHSRGAGEFFGRSLTRRVRVIPNPVAPCPVASSVAEAARAPMLIAMGRLSREKGFDVLISAFAQLANDYPDWLLCILGDGPERSALLREIEVLGLAGRVSLPGYCHSPADSFARASIFCSAARVEGFGIALCEAMACGLAVVATDAPSGPRDIVRPGVDGELVPVDDPGALASALSGLMSDPGRRLAYGARAREVVERFSHERVWSDWASLIETRRGLGS